MKIAFRVDASIKIGTGHVMRCLTLADMLKQENESITFICREEEGHLCEYIVQKGYKVERLSALGDFHQEQDAQETIERLSEYVDLIIVDHYLIDEKWEKLVREKSTRLMVVDDLANRAHVCDILLDQNYQRDYEYRYDGLVPIECKKLLGPNYLILRPEFIEEQKHVRIYTQSIKRILVFYGGSDPTNETMKALEALRLLDLSKIHVDVVVGLANPNRNKVEVYCKELGFQYHCQISYLADLIVRADIALGAGGITMWERCYLGLPTITTIVAENQRLTTEAAAEYGAIWNLGWHEKVTVEKVKNKLVQVFENTDQITIKRKKAVQLVGNDVKQSRHPVISKINSLL